MLSSSYEASLRKNYLPTDAFIIFCQSRVNHTQNLLILFIQTLPPPTPPIVNAKFRILDVFFVVITKIKIKTKVKDSNGEEENENEVALNCF